jgi:hypothetical protein
MQSAIAERRADLLVSATKLLEMLNTYVEEKLSLDQQKKRLIQYLRVCVDNAHSQKYGHCCRKSLQSIIGSGENNNVDGSVADCLACAAYVAFMTLVPATLNDSADDNNNDAIVVDEKWMPSARGEAVMICAVNLLLRYESVVYPIDPSQKKFLPPSLQLDPVPSHFAIIRLDVADDQADWFDAPLVLQQRAEAIAVDEDIESVDWDQTLCVAPITQRTFDAFYPLLEFVRAVKRECVVCRRGSAQYRCGACKHRSTRVCSVDCHRTLWRSTHRTTCSGV